MNSKAIEKKFGQSDVYDGKQAILNNYLIPGSIARGKGNDSEGKGARAKGGKEKKIAQLAGIDPEKVVIINFKRSLEGGKRVIIKISGVGVSGRGCSLYGGKC